MSKINPIFGFTVTQGKLVIDSPQKFRVRLAAFEGKRGELTVRQPKKQRSLSENAYYHAVIVAMLSEFTGYEKEEMHEILKWKFLRYVDDRGIERARSTTELSTVEAEEYYERIRRWASIDLHLYIPLPGEIPVDIYDF
jgi:hypothetical protein